ncbi:MAG: hypothetical protein II818_01905 [Aeriscardovia sp.]|nr:hypothetical protein [Aeriscardovia sp.]
MVIILRIYKLPNLYIIFRPMVDPPSPPIQFLRRRQHFIPDWRLFFKTRWKVITACLLGVLILEVFVFNLPTWQTLRAIPETENVSFLPAEDVKPVAGGFVTTKANATIRLTSSKIIKYLYLQSSPMERGAFKLINYTVGISYVGDKYVHYGSQLAMDLGVKDSRYINAGSYVHTVTLQFNEPKGTFIPVTQIVINPKVPYRFSTLRLFLLLLFAFLWVLLGPGSILWKMELDAKSLFQMVLLVLATLGVMFFYFVTWYSNGNYYAWHGIVKTSNGLWTNFSQYGDLANSLLHGHTYLNLPVSPGLKALKNPYSLSARLAIGKQGQFSFWDHAFYHGKYYCYFGVVPAILFFMPYELLTGKMLLTGWAIFTALIIANIFATLLVVRMAQFYFEDASLATTVLAIWILGIGSSMLQAAFIADFYEVPEATSYMLSMIGLWCWLKSMKRKRRSKEKYVSSAWIFFGSLCMACNLGSRPQFLFLALLAIPIYWTSVFKDRTLFSRKGLWPTIFGILPYFLVYIPIFIYNCARFGSALNFGEKYNLTGFDMTRATSPDSPFLAALIIFFYYFRPVTFVAAFPFITQPASLTPLWYPIDPPVGGGYFTFIAPFTLILFASPWILARGRRSELDRIFSKRYAHVRSVKNTVISIMAMLVASAVIITCLDGQECGYSQRYYAAIGTCFALASVFLIFVSFPTWLCREKDSSSFFVSAKMLLVFLLILTCTLEFLGLYDPGRLGRIPTVNLYRVASWFLFMN